MRPKDRGVGSSMYSKKIIFSEYKNLASLSLKAVEMRGEEVVTQKKKKKSGSISSLKNLMPEDGIRGDQNVHLVELREL